MTAAHDTQALAPLTAEERAHVIGVLRRNHDEEFINRIRATLAAGSQAVQVPGWRPIDSAPNDFVTEFDGWSGERVPNVFWGHPEYEEKGALAWCVMKSDSHGSYRERVLGLTHWMAIPAAPLQPLAGGEVTNG